MVDQEETDLVSSSIKLQTLLHKFIQLYDRLTVEHSLMTERELKLLKNLEGLNETIIELNKLGSKIATVTQESITKAVEQAWNNLASLNKKTLEQQLEHHVKDCCGTLNQALEKITSINKDYDAREGVYLALIFWSVVLGIIIAIVAKIIAIFWH